MQLAKNPERILHFLLWCGLLSNITLFAVAQFSDTDAWGHALHGRILLEQGRFAAFSDYSWISDDSTPRSAVCAIQVLLHLLLQYAGYSGFLALRFAILATICYFLWRLSVLHGVPYPVYVLSCLIFMAIGHPRFLPRGDFFNLLFFIVYLYMLEKFAARRNLWIWTIPLLQMVWANIHQLAFLGVALVGLYAFYFCLHRDWQAVRRLALLAGMCGVSLLFTPLGVGQFTQIWDVAGFSNLSRELTAQVTEFMPLQQITGSFGIIGYLGIIVTVLSLLLVNRSYRDWHHYLLFCALACGTWLYVRLLGLFAIHSAYLLSKEAARWRWHWLSAASLFFSLALALSLVHGDFFCWNLAIERCRPYPCNSLLPVQAVEFVRSRQCHENVFTDYNSGGYVAYHLYPQAKTFVHSLNLYYSVSNFRLYKELTSGKLDPASVILPYDIRLFLLEHRSRESAALIRWLYRAPDWLLVYADEGSVVFAARSSDFVQQNGLIAVDMARLAERPEIASSASNLAAVSSLLLDLGHQAEARAAAQRALRIDPRQPSALNNLGILACADNDWQAALQFFVDSAASDTRNLMPRQNIRRLFARHIVFQPQNRLHQKAAELAGSSR